MKASGALLGVAGLVAGVTIGLTGPSHGADRATQGSTGSTCAVREYAMGLRYQQQSAEAAALQGQSYAVATRNLDRIVAKYPKSQRAHLAVMTDLDETAIDNSALLVRDMEACHDYTAWDTWSDWELHGNPRLIPGASAFFHHADSLGVKVFYVSDRSDENKAATLATLRKLKLPQVNERQVLLLGPSKAVRRADIERHHTLVMQLGDSLADFSGDFKGADLATSHRLVKTYAKHFGNDWIVLPNATYGSWTSAPLTAWKRPIGASL